MRIYNLTEVAHHKKLFTMVIRILFIHSAFFFFFPFFYAFENTPKNKYANFKDKNKSSYCTKKWSFLLRIFSVHINKSTVFYDLFLFIEEILNRKLHLFRSVCAKNFIMYSLKIDALFTYLDNKKNLNVKFLKRTQIQ